MADTKFRLIDTHGHINFSAYKNDAEDVIQRCLDQGIALLTVGSQRSTSERAVNYAEKYDGMWASVGLHPIHLFEQEIDEQEVKFRSRAEEFDVGLYRDLARSSDKVAAIGECGLDYYRTAGDIPFEETKARQEEVFRAHIDLALELDLPAMIHCRDAHVDIIRILEEYHAAGKKIRGDVHCFTGTWEEAEKYLSMGFYIGFTGVVTFKPTRAQRESGNILQDVVEKVPLDRILVETDAPYLAPHPHRGERNEPSYVRFVAEKVAGIKQVSVQEVETQTTKNAGELFGIELT